MKPVTTIDALSATYTPPPSRPAAADRPASQVRLGNTERGMPWTPAPAPDPHAYLRAPLRPAIDLVPPIPAVGRIRDTEMGDR